MYKEASKQNSSTESVISKQQTIVHKLLTLLVLAAALLLISTVKFILEIRKVINDYIVYLFQQLYQLYLDCGKWLIIMHKNSKLHLKSKFSRVKNVLRIKPAVVYKNKARICNSL